MTSDYQSTIDQINSLKKHDTIDELIDDTLNYIVSIKEHAKEIGITTAIDTLDTLKKNFEFNTFIKTYFLKLDDQKIEELFTIFIIQIIISIMIKLINMTSY